MIEFTKILRNHYNLISPQIKLVCFNTGLFLLGWGLGADTFFSVYTATIVDNIFLISVFAGILAFFKMIFNIPIGDLDEKVDIRYLLVIGKILYILTGISYFLAGMFHSPILFIIGMFLNGIANPMVLTTYQSYVRAQSTPLNIFESWGLHTLFFNGAMVVGSLIIAIFIPIIGELYRVYLFISLFALLSMLGDIQIPAPKNHHTLHTTKSFLKKMYQDVFSLNTYTKTFTQFQNYGSTLKHGLILEGFYGLSNYIGFIFIPLIASQHQLSLSQIALIFAAMRFPFFFSFEFSILAEHIPLHRYLASRLCALSGLFIVIAYSSSFWVILSTTFLIAVCLSALRPVLGAYITNHMKDHHAGQVTGIQEFFSRLGEVGGSLLFGIVASIWSMNGAFMIISAVIAVVSFITYRMNDGKN